MVPQITIISPCRKPSCLEGMLCRRARQAVLQVESAGSQQPSCCFLCDAQHPKAWGKACWGDTKFFGKIHSSERASECPALPLADLTACRSPSTMPRDTHGTMTGSREGASLATLASPSSSVRSLSGDIPSLQCFLISNLIYLSPGSLRLNIILATTHELILLPGSRTVLSRTVQKIILEISSGFTGFLSPFLWSLRNNWAVKGFPSSCLSLEQELGSGEPGLILILS